MRYWLAAAMTWICRQVWRALARSLAEIDDRTMRIAGLVSMVLGTLLLYLIK